MIVEPYLFFDGRCEEAIDFYKKALGAEVTSLIRFKESPEPGSVRRARQDHARLVPCRRHDDHGVGRALSG